MKFGFTTSPSNEALPLCLVRDETLCDDAMKPSKLNDHLDRMHADKKDKDVEYHEMLKENKNRDQRRCSL